ncbi:glycosyltransferase family 2 protein [Agromyces allii]|uniref:Glycosyltransferase family 2 protein n=1 Tax=Agromyces allii TaxID=393607 RepID=A0ABP5CGH1_9MICO|nr:glycosyltransferase family 2 protein [Agromyces allii]
MVAQKTQRSGEASSVSVALDVIIVTFASRDLIQVCLDSLFEHRPQVPMRVFVVDNASPDDTVEVVRSKYPLVELIARGSNDGFSVANNVALRLTSSPYVLVLNPDTRLESGTLDHLIGVMERDATIGVLGCRLLTRDGTLDHAAKRSFPSPTTALKYFALKAIGRTGSNYTRPDVGELDFADVDAVNGAFMLVRSAALLDVGLLDERYWMYGEDLDWCARFHREGWRVVYDGRVIAHHLKGGSTSGRRPLRQNYHFHRSMLVFYRDHASKRHFIEDALVSGGVWARFATTSAVASVQRVVRRAR